MRKNLLQVQESTSLPPRGGGKPGLSPRGYHITEFITVMF